MANRDDQEEQEFSNQTETLELSSEDEHDADYDDENKASDAPKKKSGLGKIIGIVGAVVVIGAVGFTANKILFSSNPTPTPAPAPQANHEQPIPVPVAVEQPKQVQAQVTPPQTQESVVPDNSQVPQVSNGEQVLPDLHPGAVVTNDNPNVGSLGDDAPSIAPDVSKAPNIQDPVIGSSTSPDLGNNDVAPMPSVGQNVTPAQVPVKTETPPVSNSSAEMLNNSIQALIVKMDGLSTSIESVNNMIGDTNDRIDKTNTKVDELEKRIDKLEGASKNDKALLSTKSDDKNVTATKPVVKKASKAVVKKKRVSHAATSSRYNSVEIIDEDASRTYRKSYSAPKKSASVSNARLGGGYTLQSVVTDRAWVKHPNGTTSTYGVGDRLPNGHTVGSIDPDNGVYDTNGKLVLK